MTTTRGFSLIEIILAFAIAAMVFVAVFEFVTVSRARISVVPDTTMYSFPTYRYGEQVCPLSSATMDRLRITRQVALNAFVSTSTPVTSMHVLDMRTMLLTADSSIPSEPDMFLMDLETTALKASADAGPGIQDSMILGRYLHVANTSVNSHVKTFVIDPLATGTAAFVEVSSIRIGSLAQSGSMPRTIHMRDRTLILGSEKSNAGGELFPLRISANGLPSIPTSSMELGGQAHRSAMHKDTLLVSNAADPELRAYDQNLVQIAEYDAPLTLGNGKTVASIYPYLVFGRTLGSGELSLLEYASSGSVVPIDIKRTYGSVDFIQVIQNMSPVPTFVVLTSNPDAELQVWTVQGKRLQHLSDLNLPGRVSAYTCLSDSILVAMIINTVPTLVWLGN